MRSDTVEQFVRNLDHPMKPGIEALRNAILASNDAITEQVKWNAPSFVYNGEDRVTFTLHPPTRIRLVLHRGAKVRADSADFTFADPSGLVAWSTPDRGVVTFTSVRDAADKEAALLELVNRWILA